MAVSVTGTTYESIVMLYNPKGELLFSNYLSTYVIGIDISSDHKYLAIAEIDNSKIAPTTKIELVSTDSAISNAEDATVNLYQAGTNEYLSGIKFQNKGNLLCNFDKYVLKLNDTEAKKIYEISDLTAYVDTNMSSDFARVDKEESSVFKSDYRLKISDSAGKEKVYIIEGNLIDIKTKDNKVALNLGNEVLFINNKRMARKKIC